MRTLLLLAASLMFLLSITGCTRTQDKQQREPTSETVDLPTYLQSVKLPTNLTTAFDPSAVKSIDSANIYITRHLELDPESVTKHLLRGEIVEHIPQAVGPGFKAKKEGMIEYLYVYDGGKSFGTKSDVNGGLSYGVVQEGLHDLSSSSVIGISAGSPDMNEQLNENLTRSNYQSYTDLSFETYADALAVVKDKLDKIGLPRLDVVEAYSIDLETVERHYALYRENLKNRNMENEEREIHWSKDDERYLIHYRQLVDEIPVTNVKWESATGARTDHLGNYMPTTVIQVEYAKDGIVRIGAGNLYDIDPAKSGKKQSLIHAAEALRVLLDEYDELILNEGTRITTLELNYVSIPEGDAGSYKLIPAWVMDIAKPDTYKDPQSGASINYDLYGRYVVNAITGEKLSGMR
ncbi:hypothetical protein [Paenibacillus arenosi]|uniref:DUF3298 domain-containing protein n=1 Tax=Paenibacillus arenosi TaxID=2774142 RepID=A0ABR9AZK5_9BACL|nr:hypothetical protein [Paenibacillus arenosi]MBD8499499.1 hypothetical protein [Paenibacillus arenosi]